jgi:hypothetical protein
MTKKAKTTKGKSATLPEDRRCTAHNRKGERCRQPAAPGRNVCRFHGAKGGRPPVHGLFSKRLVRGVEDVYAAGAEQNLDEEIRAARALLAWALEQHAANPRGGPRPGRKGAIPRLWVDIAQAYLETVRRLLEAKARIKALSRDDERARSALDDFMALVRREAAASKPTE